MWPSSSAAYSGSGGWGRSRFALCWAMVIPQVRCGAPVLTSDLLRERTAVWSLQQSHALIGAERQHAALRVAHRLDWAARPEGVLPNSFLSRAFMRSDTARVLVRTVRVLSRRTSCGANSRFTPPRGL